MSLIHIFINHVNPHSERLLKHLQFSQFDLKSLNHIRGTQIAEDKETEIAVGTQNKYIF